MQKRKAASVQALAGLFLLAGVSWAALETPVLAQASAATALPKGVNPETRNRLPPLKREALDERRAKAYDEAAASSPTGKPQGVAAIRIYATGFDIRWASPLGRALTELVILATAREDDQPYEWTVHEFEGLSWGLDPKTIDIVRNKKPLRGVEPKQAVSVQIARELAGTHKLSPETYARGLSLLGEANLVDIVSLVANYTSTGARLTAFNQHLPVGMKQWLPLPFTQPNDIDPVSRNRMAHSKNPTTRSTALYSREIAPYGTGPFQIALHGGGGTKALEANLGPRMLGLATLATAREYHSQYEWTMAEPAARKDGLEASIIEIVRDRKPVTGLGEKEAAMILFCRELFGDHTISTETYQRALKAFGEANLVDLTGYVGQRAGNAVILAGFDQQLPAGVQPLLPVQ